MPPKRNQKPKPSKQRNRNRPRGQVPRAPRRPTLVLRDHLMINQNITGTNVKQINIAPVLSSFAAATVQAGFYEQYRVKRVSYRIMPLDTVNQAVADGANFRQLDLPYLYIVPTFTSQLPLPA